jgi:hypothetical protein
LEDLCDFNAPEQKEKERTMEKAGTDRVKIDGFMR